MSALALALIVSGAVLIRGALKGLSPLASFQDVFDRAGGGQGLPGLPTFTQRREGQGASAASFPPNVERWRSLVAQNFPAGVVDQALSVMECESQGNPNAVNPISRASGLFQHMPGFWSDRSRRAGVPGASIFDPTANVKVAGWLYSQSNTWSHWSCKPSV